MKQKVRWNDFRCNRGEFKISFEN